MWLSDETAFGGVALPKDLLLAWMAPSMHLVVGWSGCCYVFDDDLASGSPPLGGKVCALYLLVVLRRLQLAPLIFILY